MKRLTVFFVEGTIPSSDAKQTYGHNEFIAASTFEEAVDKFKEFMCTNNIANTSGNDIKKNLKIKNVNQKHSILI